MTKMPVAVQHMHVADNPRDNQGVGVFLIHTRKGMVRETLA